VEAARTFETSALARSASRGGIPQVNQGVHDGGLRILMFILLFVVGTLERGCFVQMPMGMGAAGRTERNGTAGMRKRSGEK
jgi:hypothetical protein